MKKAILLLSGGIDSASVVPLLQDEGISVTPLFCRYGQESETQELQAARYFAAYYGLAPLEIRDVTPWSKSGHPLLTGQPLATDESAIIPHRNLFLGVTAAIVAEEIQAQIIAFGFFKASTRLSHDASPQFVEALESMLNWGSRGPHMSVWKTCFDYSKEEMIERALRRNIPLEYSYSCYYSRRCGECFSCRQVAEAFQRLEGIVSPAILAAHNPMRLIT